MESSEADLHTQPRLAVVTGASRGIGRATAQGFAALGYEVVLVARNLVALESAAEGIRSSGGLCHCVPADVGDRQSLSSLVSTVSERWGRVDALVNNAGVLPVASRSEQLDVHSWESALDVNLTAAWYLSSRLKPAMPRGSVVINISSTAALYPSVGLAPYCASKAALNMLTKVLALEWAADGIRVIAVAPGKVRTDLVTPILQYAKRRGTRINALDRVAEPEEIASLICFLASDEASYMTGCVVTSDGGELLQRSTD